MYRRLTHSIMICAMLALTTSAAYSEPNPKVYNTVKTKLAQGKQVFGGTIDSYSEDMYCAMANAGWDFLWIEMQHSSLTYDETAKMIGRCRGAAAIPFIRVPDATEGDIQKAVDIGALGIIIPMVDTLDKIQNAVKFAKYPPTGRRSSGSAQARELWGGADYRQTANDNIMIVAMIENPAGVAMADKIASVPGVDVVFVASGDLGSFSGKKQGDPEYEALATAIKEATLKAGRKVAGPSAWRDRPGYSFFQGPPAGSLIADGTKLRLSREAKIATPESTGVVIPEGEENFQKKK